MLVKKIIKTLLITILSLFFTANSFSLEPKDFVQQTVDDAARALDQSLSKELKIIKLKEIAEKTVDIKGLASYTIGKKRKELSPEELEKYEELFEKYFLKSFTSRLTDYSDPKINVLSADVKSEKYTIVKTMLVKTDKKPEVKIDWRVYTKNPDNPLIRDLIVEGLSLARTQKEEFSSILSANDGDINALFKKLAEFVN